MLISGKCLIGTFYYHNRHIPTLRSTTFPDIVVGVLEIPKHISITHLCNVYTMAAIDYSTPSMIKVYHYTLIIPTGSGHAHGGDMAWNLKK